MRASRAPVYPISLFCKLSINSDGKLISSDCQNLDGPTERPLQIERGEGLALGRACRLHSGALLTAVTGRRSASAR
jgi:hypothetical protein